jgi:excisionase family DNA binding protein
MKNKKTDRSEFMTLPEVAEYLRLSIHTIYKMAQKGRIPALKAGAVWRFNRAEIDEWMRSEAERRQEERRKKARGGN